MANQTPQQQLDQAAKKKLPAVGLDWRFFAQQYGVPEDEDELSLRIDQDLLREFSCLQCGQLLRNPQTLYPCGHTFCADCVDAASRGPENVVLGDVPSKVPKITQCPECRSAVQGAPVPAGLAASFLDSILPHACSGCGHKHPRSQEAEHLQTCPNAVVCSECALRYASQASLQTHACPGAWTNCPGCEARIRAKELLGHFERCLKMTHCCGEWRAPEPMETHQKNNTSCPNGLFQCRFGCEHWIFNKIEFETEHQALRCPNAVLCEQCQTRVARSEFEAHAFQCPKRLIGCDFCDRHVPREAWEFHHRYFHHPGTRFPAEEEENGAEDESFLISSIKWQPREAMNMFWPNLVMMLCHARVDNTREKVWISQDGIKSSLPTKLELRHARLYFEWASEERLRIYFGPTAWIEGRVLQHLWKSPRTMSKICLHELSGSPELGIAFSLPEERQCARLKIAITSDHSDFRERMKRMIECQGQPPFADTTLDHDDLNRLFEEE